MDEIQQILRTIRKRDVPKSTIRNIGVRGAIKSLFYTYRTSVDGLIVLGKKTSVEINDPTNVNVRNAFLLDSVNSPTVDQALGGSRLRIGPKGKLEVTGEKYARVGSCSILNINGDFAIGDVQINGHCRIFCLDKITIKDGCHISWEVDILDNNGGHQLRVDGEERQVSSPVEIGEDVWIGHHSTIQQGVTIGKGSVIGSNSLVVDDIPAHSLAVGSPAKVVSQNVHWEP